MKSRLRLATPVFLPLPNITLNETIHISHHDKYLYHLSPFYFLLTNNGDSKAKIHTNDEKKYRKTFKSSQNKMLVEKFWRNIVLSEYPSGDGIRGAYF